MSDRQLPEEEAADGLPASLARLFEDEVERARNDLEASTHSVHLHRVRRQGTSHAGSLAVIAIAGAILVAVLVLRPDPGRPAASTASASPGNASASPLPATPVAANDPAGWMVITWSQLSAPAFAGPGNQYVAQIVSWHQGFMAVGYEEAGGVNTGLVWLSPDGLSWERVPDPESVFRDAQLQIVAVQGDRFVVAGFVQPSSTSAADTLMAAGTPAMWTSDDGRHWQRSTADEGTFDGAYVSGLAVGPAGFIAYGGRGGSNMQPLLWSSVDGGSWHHLEIPVTTFGLSNADLTIAGTPRGYVAAQWYGGTWWSPDGKSWTPATVDAGGWFTDVAVARGGLLATGLTGGPPTPGSLGPPRLPMYWQSADGLAWQLLPRDDQPPSARLGGSVRGSGSIFVGVSSWGQVWTSIDGLAWQKVVTTSESPGLSTTQPFSEVLPIGVGAPGLVGASHGRGTSATDHSDVTIWFGAASWQLPDHPLPPLPNDYQNDATCVGGEGGDPGVVCIDNGYYVRNNTADSQLLRLSGAVQEVLSVPAQTTGQLVNWATVRDSGSTLTIELLSSDCAVTQEFSVRDPLALLVINPAGEATLTTSPPPVALPTTPFAPAATCPL